MRKIKKILVTLLTTVMVFNLGITGAFANTDVQKSVQPVIFERDLNEEIISKTDPYITLGQDGLFEISNYEELSQVLTEIELELVKNQINNINAELRNSVDVSDSENVSINESSKLVTIYAKDTLIEVSSNEAVNKIEWKWFGIRVYLSKSTVNDILNAGLIAGAKYIGIQFPGVRTAIAVEISGYLISEFGTQYVSRAIYVDVGLKWSDLSNPEIVGIRSFGFQ